ncbi:DNA-binding GntR family transcriptional regulator [Breoghania corrubedonensis]|uniref:DNA-binding GntR family transcriptional regulator n=1 Tax=Breoghania corrubedonensis TaxID=665038 RepID=A0A2T5VE46_9HYPH|nr:GntR family transcriptional regulator [Breoghania corrubedonensis]PTW62024.1 DNA-binding GntR family transcriptional regulator [Breoghania corrubedonensis]
MKYILESDPDKRSLKAVDRTYLRLKEMVINYEILPGQPILIEAVSHRLNVSVTPVREALNRLLYEGLIIQLNGRGFQNRAIDHEELTDLLVLRGSLAVSSLHFLLSSDLRHQIEDILAAGQSEAASADNLPVCRTVLRAVGNREILRIYENVNDKLHYIWSIYAASEEGAKRIREYTSELERHLRARDLPGSLDVIYRNIQRQVQMLDDIIPQAIGRLYVAHAEPQNLRRRLNVPAAETSRHEPEGCPVLS